MESLGPRVYTVYSLMQIANDPSERWLRFVLAPAVNGNACFSVLAKLEDMLVRTSNEYIGVMKGNRCTEASLILMLDALPLSVVWEGRGRCRGHLQAPIYVSVQGLSAYRERQCLWSCRRILSPAQKPAASDQ